MPNPNKNIPYTYYQDIQTPDADLQSQLRNYFKTGQYQAAINLLNQNQAQLNTKAYVASVINQLTYGISYLETAFNNGVPVFLSNLTTDLNNLIGQFINRSQYNPSTQYKQFNFVVSNNDVYMALSDPPVGTAPTVEQYWLHLGLRGEQGSPGVDVTMKYDWVNTATYQPNDLVVYNGNIYVALQQNTNSPPGQNQDNWLLFVNIPRGQIYVSNTEPQGPYNDMIWFKTAVDPMTAQANVGLVGTFNRYIASTQTWDEMYPNVLYTWIVDRALYRKQQVELDITIASSQWTGDPATWTYTYAGLDDDSVVNILPASGLNETQAEIYNNLDISIADTTITLTCIITPTADLNIRMVII